LKEAGLVEVIAEMSKAVAKTQTPDLCTCSKAACVEKMTSFKSSAGAHRLEPFVVAHGGKLDGLIAGRKNAVFLPTDTTIGNQTFA
jgi:hypothetical protein